MNKKAEDTFEMEHTDVGTTKVALSNNIVPLNKFARKVYGMLLNNRDGTAAATITFTIEKDTTVERTIPAIVLGANVFLNVSRELENPIITIGPGQNIKAQVTAGTGPVSVMLQAYDL